MAVGVKALIDMPREVIDERSGWSGTRASPTNSSAAPAGYAAAASSTPTTIPCRSAWSSTWQACGRAAKRRTTCSTISWSSRRWRRWCAGGRLQEYSAHLIPEGGYDMIPELVGDGILVAGDAAALCNATGVNLEGINLAAHSGSWPARRLLPPTRRGISAGAGSQPTGG